MAPACLRPWEPELGAISPKDTCELTSASSGAARELVLLEAAWHDSTGRSDSAKGPLQDLDRQRDILSATVCDAGAGAQLPSTSSTIALPGPQLTVRSTTRRLDAGRDSCSLRVASLNLGGRNTNPLEFELKGDTSETGVEAATLLRSAARAMSLFEDGPSSMVSAEREAVDEIMAEIYGGEEAARPPLYRFVQGLLHCETWAQVVAKVTVKCPYLFNALNLATLMLKRPSVWEDPASCRSFSNACEYLVAWKEWYFGLDRTSVFWLEDAPRTAKKRDMDTATALAGLLVFDLMCLFSARGAALSGCEDLALPAEEGREIPFKQIVGLAAKLPSASLTARDGIVEAFLKETHVVFAREAREFARCPIVAEEFLAPVSAGDNITAVYLRKGVFAEVSDITKEVADQMEGLGDCGASESAQKAWRATAESLAAVRCRCLPHFGGFTACLVSLHCSKSDCTAAFVEALRDVIDEYGDDIKVAGLDSNCSAEDAGDFQERLRNAGCDIGCHPKQDQVTVAKRRTSFQTQVQKIGRTDVSHRDYIVSWSSRQICRAATAYTPDLRTAYGVEQETKQCVRLPTTQWPFDHCGVTTTFRRQPSRRKLILRMLCQRRSCRTLCMVCFLLLIILLPPLVSPERQSMYGPPGTWHSEGWAGNRRPGICKAAAPCGEGWRSYGGSCYSTTPRLGYLESVDACRNSNGEMVTIASEAENQFITENICPEEEFCWIGLLTDHARENARWASGEPVTYMRLAEYTDFILPIHALSHGTDYKVSILSNFPGVIEGCQWEYAFSLMTTPLGDALVDFVAPALSMVVSAFLLLLPRPPHLLTSVYLVMSLLANTIWYSLKMWRVCFTSDIGQFMLLDNIGNVLDEGMHTCASFTALWIIIRRMSVLRPSRDLRVGFAGVLGTALVVILIMGCFIDTTSSSSFPNAAVGVAQVIKFFSVSLLLLLGVTMSRDLYRAWSLMRREAASGKSGQVSHFLTDAIRAANYHFYSILAATISSALRAGSILAVSASMYWPAYPVWGRTLWTTNTLLDSVTNDVCAYVLASMNMDGAILRTKGITNDVMVRAAAEVEQHRLAVDVLKAAPTSTEQLRHLAMLESKARSSAQSGKEDQSFRILQSAVRAETARIHHLMFCVRLRAMTMPVRYQYLIDVPTVLDAAPRQHVPREFLGEESAEAASRYFSWLHRQAAAAQEVLFHHVNQLLAKFSSTPWPSDLGLAMEQFPWTIWASGAESVEARKLGKADTLSPGDILIHCQATERRFAATKSCSYCVVLEEINPSHVRIHRSGMHVAEEVPREELRTCHSGGVFLPGPLKKQQRCLDKVKGDYEGVVAWPAAASLTDIARCTILLDDPYAMAVLVSYIQANMKVLRLKNRFCQDRLEPLAPEALQVLFNNVADHDAEARASSSASTGAGSSVTSNAHQYRDISMNVEVTVSGLPFVCEVQLTLANLAILKHADTNLYSVRRMKSPAELPSTYVFSSQTSLDGEGAPLIRG